MGFICIKITQRASDKIVTGQRLFSSVASHMWALYITPCQQFACRSVTFELCMFLFAALNQQRITQSAPVKQGGQLPSSTHSGVMGGNNQMRLQQIEKERLRLKQHEALRQRPQVSALWGETLAPIRALVMEKSLSAHVPLKQKHTSEL